MKEYDKLIRDKIPRIIEEDGKDYEIRILDDDEYRTKLSEKLLEEADEYAESEDPEELADVLEVILVLLDQHDLSREELDEIRRHKREERGCFHEQILLERAEE